MATICLLSAKGSPGVTTTTVGLALAWPTASRGRAALGLDADPIGGDVAAGILRGSASPGIGVLSLATARGVDALAAVDAASVPLRADRSVRLLPGVPDSARAGALVLAWDRLLDARPALEAEAVDLLVDAGRVDLHTGAHPWVAASDLALLLVRPTLPAVTAARRLAAAWLEPAAPTASTPLSLVVVAEPSVYKAREVADAVGVTLHAVLPFEPLHARVHSLGDQVSRAFVRSGYVRALEQCARDIAERVVGAQASRPEPAWEPLKSATRSAEAISTRWPRGGGR